MPSYIIKKWNFCTQKNHWFICVVLVLRTKVETACQIQALYAYLIYDIITKFFIFNNLYFSCLKILLPKPVPSKPNTSATVEPISANVSPIGNI